jgi:hypothetical protein
MTGYEVSPDELASQAGALRAVSDEVERLRAAADRLAGRLPKLGTAPPALHFAMRLRAMAGRDGHAGAVGTAGSDLDAYHRALSASAAHYAESDADGARRLAP